jgi:hypothetical protein
MLKYEPKLFLKKEVVAQIQCLKPVILATWKADIKRIMVLGQQGQKVHEIPISTNG